MAYLSTNPKGSAIFVPQSVIWRNDWYLKKMNENNQIGLFGVHTGYSNLICYLPVSWVSHGIRPDVVGHLLTS